MAEASERDKTYQTELVDKPIATIPSRALETNVYKKQNQTLLPLEITLSRAVIWAIKKQSNNMSSDLTNRDAENMNKVVDQLEREFGRIKENNDDIHGVHEDTVSVRFITDETIFGMPNGKAQQWALKLRNAFKSIITLESNRCTSFVTPHDLGVIESLIKRLRQFTEKEIGDGSPEEGNEGVFNTGADWANHREFGELSPNVSESVTKSGEPGPGTPENSPADVADIK